MNPPSPVLTAIKAGTAKRRVPLAGRSRSQWTSKAVVSSLRLRSANVSLNGPSPPPRGGSVSLMMFPPPPPGSAGNVRPSLSLRLRSGQGSGGLIPVSTTEHESESEKCELQDADGRSGRRSRVVASFGAGISPWTGPSSKQRGGVRVKVLMMWWFPPYLTPLTAGEGHKRICKSWMTCATHQTREAWRDSRMAYFFRRMIPMSLRVYFS